MTEKRTLQIQLDCLKVAFNASAREWAKTQNIHNRLSLVDDEVKISIANDSASKALELTTFVSENKKQLPSAFDNEEVESIGRIIDSQKKEMILSQKKEADQVIIKLGSASLKLAGITPSKNRVRVINPL